MADLTSRFQLVAGANMLPGVDIVTGSAVGPFIDTGRDMAFSETGRIYLSVDTVREMAEQAGLFEPYAQHILDSRGSGYDQGYADALEEVQFLDGLAHDLADRIGTAAARAGGVLAPLDAIVDAGADEFDTGVRLLDDEAPGAGSDSADGAAGQGDGAPVDDRPARVPSRSGDESALRL